jgi:hypothetical protein
MTFSAGRIGAACRLGLLLVLPVAAGCGGQPDGRVSGQVKFNGKPLTGGYVLFLPGDPKRNSVTAVLDGEGRFSVVLPAGNVRVSVDNRDLEPRPAIRVAPSQLQLPDEVKQKMGGPAANPPPATQPRTGGGNSGRYVKIPDRYYDAATSGLNFKVEGGDQKYDVELSN